MKIQYLIDELEELKLKHGNVEVLTYIDLDSYDAKYDSVKLVEGSLSREYKNLYRYKEDAIKDKIDEKDLENVIIVMPIAY